MVDVVTVVIIIHAIVISLECLSVRRVVVQRQGETCGHQLTCADRVTVAVTLVIASGEELAEKTFLQAHYVGLLLTQGVD